MARELLYESFALGQSLGAELVSSSCPSEAIRLGGPQARD